MSADASTKFRRLSGTIAAVTGIAVLAGWYNDIDWLKYIVSQASAMKPNTALGFILCGIALGLFDSTNASWQRIGARCLAVFIMTLGIFTLAEYIFHTDLGIDAILIPANRLPTGDQTRAIRMPPANAICFLLYGYSFLVIRSNVKLTKILGQWAFHLITLTAFVAILGYLFSVSPADKLPFLTAMAIHSSLLFFWLSIGASAIQIDKGLTALFFGERTGNKMSRTLFPFIVLAMVVLCYLRIYSYRQRLISVESGITLLAVSFLLVVLLIIWIIAGWLNKIDDHRKRAEQALITANRLYSFLSHINQTIVHATDAGTVYKEACRIAIDDGNFKAALIWQVNSGRQILNLVAHCGLKAEDAVSLADIDYQANERITDILKTGTYYLCNDIPGQLDSWKGFCEPRGFLSCMALPVWQSGQIIAIYTLFAPELDFFGPAENSLLKEAAGDISFAMDIFDKERQRQQVMKELSHSEQRLRQAQEIAHVGSWELSFESRKAFWSEEACKIYGLDLHQNEQPADAWLRFVHPEDAERVIQAAKDAEHGAYGTSLFYRIVRKDGTIRHIYVQSQFEKGVGLQGIVHDVTEIKEAEAAIRQSENNLSLIVNLIPQAVYAKDYEGRFVFVNRSCAELYGYSPEELLHKAVNEVIPPENDAAIIMRQDREIIQTGRPKTTPEMHFIDHQGNERILLSMKVPYTMPGTNIKAVLGIALDITAQKHADAERAEIVADMIRRNEDLEQFSYIVSHNLRVPVANIIGLAGILEVATDTEERDAILEKLAVSVLRLDEVIKDLNDILQTRTKVNERWEPVNLTELLDQVRITMDKLIRDEGAQIVADFSKIGEVRTIKSYLYSIFFSLISNSIKYRQPGLRPVVNISGHKTNKIITFIFADNGLGIDMTRYGEQVFGLYKKFHLHIEGKGMGLYMTKTQVEALGGSISVKSEPGTGTTFRIAFPLKKIY